MGAQVWRVSARLFCCLAPSSAAVGGNSCIREAMPAITIENCLPCEILAHVSTRDPGAVVFSFAHGGNAVYVVPPMSPERWHRRCTSVVTINVGQVTVSIPNVQVGDTLKVNECGIFNGDKEVHRFQINPLEFADEDTSDVESSVGQSEEAECNELDKISNFILACLGDSDEAHRVARTAISQVADTKPDSASEGLCEESASSMQRLCEHLVRRCKCHCTRVVRLDRLDDKFKDVQKQYEKKWMRGSPTKIAAIYEIISPHEKRKPFEQYRQEIGPMRPYGHGDPVGNVQRRFHGTRLKCKFEGGICDDKECSVCGIIANGFDKKKVGAWSKNKGLYGAGLYSTSRSDTAKGYGLNTKAGYSFLAKNWASPDAGNALFVCKVICGRVERSSEVGSLWNFFGRASAHDIPKDFHARIVDKRSGADELVVFRAEQMQPRYLIVF